MGARNILVWNRIAKRHTCQSDRFKLEYPVIDIKFRGSVEQHAIKLCVDGWGYVAEISDTGHMGQN